VPRTTIADIQKLKGKKKIVTMTSYDFELARIMERAGADMLLVGDTGTRYNLGGEDIEATVDEMVLMTRSVSRAAKRAPVIGDMPFLSYQVSTEAAIANAGRFMKEARADAIKLEGGEDVAPTIRAIVKAGIPVMGHMGVTPQTALAHGGNFNAEGAGGAADQIRRDAFALQEAGVFAIVFTRVPPDLAAQLTKELRVPTLAGGGSGDDCDGQVCVIHGVFGISVNELDEPKSLYGPLAVPIYETAKQFCDDVRAGKNVRSGRDAVSAN
jgi:3-methyl-2-oxobutanoate hydroxymethyltransferase